MLLKKKKKKKKLAVVPKRGSERRGPTPRLNAWATQLQRNVAAWEAVG